MFFRDPKVRIEAIPDIKPEIRHPRMGPPEPKHVTVLLPLRLHPHINLSVHHVQHLKLLHPPNQQRHPKELLLLRPILIRQPTLLQTTLPLHVPGVGHANLGQNQGNHLHDF